MAERARESSIEKLQTVSQDRQDLVGNRTADPTRPEDLLRRDEPPLASDSEEYEEDSSDVESDSESSYSRMTVASLSDSEEEEREAVSLKERHSSPRQKSAVASSATRVNHSAPRLQESTTTPLCELLMYGNTRLRDNLGASITPETALGWRFQYNHLKHVKYERVGQSMADEVAKASSVGEMGGRTKRKGDGALQQAAAIEAAQPLPNRHHPKSVLSEHRVCEHSDSYLPLVVTNFIGRFYGGSASQRQHEESETEDDSETFAVSKNDKVIIEPDVLNSYRFDASLLLPIERRRKNTNSVFRTRRRNSDLWRMIVETTAPEGWVGYLRDGWWHWENLSGKGAIEDRFTHLRVFEGQQRIPVGKSASFPQQQNQNLTAFGRRSVVRQEIFGRVWSVATRKFIAAFAGRLGMVPMFNYINYCTFENLVKSGMTLADLFDNLPSTAISFDDLVILFELDTVEVLNKAKGMVGNLSESKQEAQEGASATAKQGGGGTAVLRVLKYNPQLHFLHPDRFNINHLTKPPWNLTWRNLLRFGRIKTYRDFVKWGDFFAPHELHLLKFKFADQLSSDASQTIIKEAMNRENFMLLCNLANQQHRRWRRELAAGEPEPAATKWTYSTLFGWLDFGDLVIEQLELTQFILGNVLGYSPPVGVPRDSGEENEGDPEESIYANLDKQTVGGCKYLRHWVFSRLEPGGPPSQPPPPQQPATDATKKKKRREDRQPKQEEKRRGEKPRRKK